MPTYPTSEAAEAAYYQSFEQADLSQMMDLWADVEHIGCVHPMGPYLRGRAAVEKSWREIFRDGPKMRIELSDVARHVTGDIAVHSLTEHILIVGASKKATPLLTTNVYQRFGDSWRMILHHASLSPAALLQARQENVVLH